jgi:Zn-dependent peptidase ImmA (M78 family)/DNA-binding XRE family transcriptional regulator
MSAEDARTAAALFDPQRLRLARLMRGMRKNQLAAACGVSPSAITQYELGRARPRPAMVAQLSLTLRFPPTYFASDGRPLPRIDSAPAFFRSLSRTSQLERDQAEAQATAIWDLLEAIGADVDLPEVDLPEHAVSEAATRTEVEAIAEAVRQEWNLAARPVPSVVGLLELHGAIVSRLPSITRSVDAFTKLVEGRPIVVLWAGKDHVRSRFDAAHELGHLVLHSEPEAGNRILEHQAHAFASAFLMPRELVMPLLPRNAPRRAEWDALFALKRRLGVSVAALLYRARTLGVLTESAYRRAVITMSERGWRTSEPHDIPTPETPRLLRAATELLERERGTSLADLADRARLPHELVNSLIEPPRLRLTPTELTTSAPS